MCGICGFTSKIDNQKKYLSNMMKPLESRGPDAEGFFSDDKINLGHKRLSIIDINPRSDQPMFDKETGIILIFNGEIYNYIELKKRIISQFNCKFFTNSDTEVILKYYKYFGTDCFKEFDGMFAIAIWDPNKENLILARDRFGEKPLYYSFFENNGKKQISFSSNLNSLKNSPKFNNSLNKRSLKSFLINNYVNSYETFYEKVNNIEPGSILIFKNNQIEIKKYFNISKYFSSKERYKKFDLEEFNQILIDSIKSRLISDVEVGVFLSGGLDSSLIASVAKNLGKDIKSYTLAFEEKSFDESIKANYVSNYLDISNEKFIIGKNDLNNIDEIVLSFGEPVADTSIIPTYFLSKFASKQVKVCLGGDGGDEMFYGYDTYSASKTYDIFKKFKINFILKNTQFLKNFLPTKKTKVNFFYALKKFIKAFENTEKNFFVHEFWRKINDSSTLSKIVNKELYSEISKLDINYYDTNIVDTEIASHRNLCDFKFFLEKDILVKSDRCSMANSLELRSPFLSYELFKYMSDLDPQQKYKAFNKKKILKDTAKRYLPEKIINQKKRGFNAPISHWMNTVFNQKFNDLLNSQSIKQLFNTKEIEKILVENKKNNKDYGNELFNIFCLAIWINNNKLNI